MTLTVELRGARAGGSGRDGMRGCHKAETLPGILKCNTNQMAGVITQSNG